MFTWLKQFMPKSLYGRAALILIVPIVSLQLVVSVVFIQRHFNRITEQMTSAVAAELDYVQRLVDEAPNRDEALAAITPLSVPLALRITLPGEAVPDRLAITDLTGFTVDRVLRENLTGLQGVDLKSDRSVVLLGFATRYGQMEVAFSRRRVSATNPHQLLVLMVGTGFLMTVVAFLFLRNQLRPILRLGRAAEAFGKGQVVPYRISGATEVRAAGRAFLNMRARIERQIEQRTMMLSGVSHDLRTPLTRMKLSLSMLEDADRKELEQDVEEMSRLVNSFLDFARDDSEAEGTEDCDATDIARRVIDKFARAGKEVQSGPLQAQGRIPLRIVAIERALENLLGNAMKYGSQVRLSVLEGRGDLRFVIEDDGPGIPADLRDEALKPFSRLDAARNQDKGSGVGLGLAIANDVARSHGGHMRLGESADLGGLKIELVLPR
ncbi:Osmolarity sensor protein EnvZ [Aliiroseovarius sp. xm-m-379]|uniref:ATP-binding protein n=1 Tax=unclassified Aliiroseovarius TaxID=2623558 RepID=UPI001567C8CE|nr:MULTISPECIES: ATP-binding protein [unclassified Aliiroseovarius]NRP11790.1 Osmolarity sensor protein EnvZ [Aliiroseovarius sp. xm-d-517]NRP26090.1 Osmolarity sensor protein EnvZ [Aliiroseovarius sp. xm-m-379]NRP31573.1 Osmolarity sensor protein EnvZ [Aliiroseovarius sp. xm-m-314]NRP34889.1 Osmolarity sensor protein EnvZ [Aliiroseovarius sp. xm-a-104]NRP42116.1 Osmolarity sensor protein EnvZ [Aliiroseovarius sp. xm-m-339-2]